MNSVEIRSIVDLHKWVDILTPNKKFNVHIAKFSRTKDFYMRLKFTISATLTIRFFFFKFEVYWHRISYRYVFWRIYSSLFVSFSAYEHNALEYLHKLNSWCVSSLRERLPVSSIDKRTKFNSLNFQSTTKYYHF